MKSAWARLWICFVAACDTAEPLPRPSHAALFRTCAPFDGPAVTLFLTEQAVSAQPAPPYSAVSVHRDISALLGRRFDLTPETLNLGMVQVCPAEGNCDSDGSGWISFGGLNPDSTVEIAYRVALSSGRTLGDRIRVRYRTGRALCG